ncbi:MAG: hypothetical protein CMD72_04025 [Gammaproteobacteria bacterium]|nr:hypothetical protein [Gammaproteobacteria bacterium]
MELNLIGDLMIDEYKFYSISRISPEAPVPVLLFKKYHKALGGSGNLAACLSILGYKINLFGVCSSDSFAEVASLCDKHDLSPQLIFNNKNLLTTKKLRILGDENQLCRIDTDSALDKKNLEAFTEHVHKNINHNAVTALSDYAKGVSDIFIDVNKISPPKYIDPKYPDWKRYKGCKFMKANNIEFDQAAKYSKSKSPYELMEKFEISNLIVTRGNNGCFLYSNGKEIHIEGINTKSIDVTGAGDSFMASFIWANEYGYDINSSLSFANAAAAFSVTRLGAYAPNFYEILQNLSNKMSIKVKSRNEYMKVIIGGCFDCLHAGHVYLFHEAMKIADNVVVAINSDSSVSKLKGANRPYQNLQTRIDNIEKLGFASKVISFDEATPIRILNDENPDVFLKGGDYSGDEDFEDFKFCRNKNIRIQIIPTKDGFSSSRVINEIL